jgi:hypothetical protein
VTGVAIWSKTNFGPTGHHQPQRSSILNASTKCIMKVVFCEGVQYRLRLSQNGGLSVLSSIGEKEKNRLDGG